MKCTTCGKMACMAHGGSTDMYEMEPDVPSMHGMDEGGEAGGDDSELNDMVADELLQAIESKDKSGLVEAIRALVMNLGGK